MSNSYEVKVVDALVIDERTFANFAPQAALQDAHGLSTVHESPRRVSKTHPTTGPYYPALRKLRAPYCIMTSLQSSKDGPFDNNQTDGRRQRIYGSSRGGEEDSDSN
mmetsp:Transcript_48581/g.72492  ORF Transcript_48581/g.72492 Transcript_48581/m.72492 type:complete len:107 (-) Transcript_48581:4220-4540(-)